MLAVIVVVGTHDRCVAADPPRDVEAADRAKRLGDADAAKLGRRLLDDRPDDGDTDVMARVLRLMDESAERMHLRFDPGPGTQAVQQEVIEQLDDAIKVALKQRGRTSRSIGVAGDRRTMPGADPSRSRSEKSGTGKASTSTARRSPPPDDRLRIRRGVFRESRRGWGRLPDRDRERILQGIDDSFAQPYRELIEAYYRTLADPDAPDGDEFERE